MIKSKYSRKRIYCDNPGTRVAISDNYHKVIRPSLCPGSKLRGKIVTTSNFCQEVIVTISVFYCKHFKVNH